MVYPFAIPGTREYLKKVEAPHFKSEAKQSKMCQRCLCFIQDYLLLPSAKGDPFYSHVREAKLHSIASLLASEFYNFLQRITPSQSYMITNHSNIILKDLQTSHCQKYDTSILQGIALFSAAEKTVKGEMDVLKTLVEDCHILKRSMKIEAWLGYVLAFLWIHLDRIHTEHERNAVCSYAGPAMGMKSHQVYQRTITVVDHRTEEQKEFDELYN